MGLDDWVSFSRFKNAVKKVRFILSFQINRWRLSSLIGSASRRRLSIEDRRHSGLLGFMETMEGTGGESSRGVLQRATSVITSDEDIDDKAERFIANFYRQLQIERQISLELQYCRNNSMESTSWSP